MKNKNKFFTKDRIFFMILAVSGIILLPIGLRGRGAQGSARGFARHIIYMYMAIGGANIIVGLLGSIFSNCMRVKTTLIALVPSVTAVVAFFCVITSSRAYPIESTILSIMFVLLAVSCVILLIYYTIVRQKQSVSIAKTAFGVFLDIITAVVYFFPIVYVGDFVIAILNMALHGSGY